MEDKKCKCGNLLTDQNVSFENRCNEEGEEWSIYIFDCEMCHRYFEISDWGECDDIEEAISKVFNYIKEENN